MKIHEILDRDPRSSGLINNGQARISSLQDDKAIQELRAELETFVCDGQYGDAIQRILADYLTNLDRSRQSSAWIAGFYGSGKSHLLKMMEHLWVNTKFADGSTARSLVRGLPDDVKAQLTELDIKAKRSDKPLVSAAGTLPAGSGDHVRRTILSIILNACDWPEQYAQARFCFWLREEGYLESVRSGVEAAGREWLKELNNLYVSPYIANALLQAYPTFASNEAEVRKILREQYPVTGSDISTNQFIDMIRKALSADDTLPLTILVLDEVQQYIADDSDRAVLITEAAEAIQTRLDSRVMLVASGQSALSNTPNLQRLRDRFTITAQLSDTDVEAVTRKVILSKKASANSKVEELLERHSGEIDRHLKDSKLRATAADRSTRTADYPLLPARRRFWEACFRTVDAAGSNSQLRSQLRILHDSLHKIADSSLGAVLPSSDLYHVLAPDLVNAGVLLNEISNRIQRLDDGTDDGKLKQSLCGLIFLIGKLPNEGAMDLGVRADAATLADLELTDITEPSGTFRKRVEELLEEMVDDGVTMKIDQEYRLQTNEGSEWDQAFREKQQAVRQDDTEIARLRDNAFGQQVRNIVSEIKLLHGAAKVKRTVMLHVGDDVPKTDGQQVAIWLRDEWMTSQKEAEGQAHKLGQDDPTLHVFLPKRSPGDLKSRIVEAEAARQVLDLKGTPSSREGEEAHSAMESRRRTAERSRDGIVREIIGAARVYQGGGAEVFGDNLLDRLRAGAEQSLARMFPRFSEGDNKAWEVALKRARDGSDEPFKIVGWDKPTDEHPVCKEVLATVGVGRKGSEIQKALCGGQFGWPQDAIDAALIALHSSDHLRANDKNSQPIAAGRLDQAGVKSADFRPQSERLTAQEKITLRGMYQKLGNIAVKPGHEVAQAAEFLIALSNLASKAGGAAPLPPHPNTNLLADIQTLAGNELLRGILDHQDELTDSAEAWTKLARRAELRSPIWELISRLQQQALDLEVAREIAPELSAVETECSLLADTDLVSPLLGRLAGALRAEATTIQANLETAISEAASRLAHDANWQQLGPDAQADILRVVGLESPAPPSMALDEDLCRSLEKRSLASMRDEIDAVQQREARALAEAAKKIAPEKTTTQVHVRRCTLNNADDVRSWIQEQEQKLLDAIDKGPVIIN